MKFRNQNHAGSRPDHVPNIIHVSGCYADAYQVIFRYMKNKAAISGELTSVKIVTTGPDYTHDGNMTLTTTLNVTASWNYLILHDALVAAEMKARELEKAISAHL